MTQPAVQRARTLRWAVPVAAVAVVGAIASGVFSASADTALPPRSAAQLLADVESASVPAHQGTVVEMAALGLPDLPTVGTGSGGSSTSMLSLLSGSHTVKVWYGGPARQRVALLGTVGETDVFHNGTDLWQWDSDSNKATHLTLPTQNQHPHPAQTGALTPDQVAQQALSAIDPSTAVSIDAERTVAGRKAYELVLTPRDTTSRVGSVRIAIDGETSLPLGVQVFGRGDSSSPALDVSFTSISYGEPDASMFEFSPPAGATVTTPASPASQPDGGASSGQPSDEQQPADPQVIGEGWTSVLYAHLPQAPTGAALDSLQAVSGTWGSGRLVDSALLSALITDDGRVFVGAVDPSALYAAAGSHR